MNIFTQGQKTRMHALFSSGSVRESFADCIDINIQNQTISTDKNINGCNDITIEDVKILSTANVVINAENNLIIEKDFEVLVGSTLEIN